jgi:hypothetical protein
MANHTIHADNQDYAWFIAVPKRYEFTEPTFHFGERVKFCQKQGSERNWETGRIIGMRFVEEWLYNILLDHTSTSSACEIQELTAKAVELKLVPDACSVREQLHPQKQWLLTAEAALQLNLTATQLRKLRLNGLFRSGYHVRDISVPNSGLPRWQWHVERCGKAIEASGKRRLTH